jgi:hypothetical protein
MELEDLMNDSIEKLEKDFYSKKFEFSYSSLNKLMWNPAVFHQLYVLGLKEEKTDAHLVNGKLVHGLLLEPEKFNEQFMVSPDNLPTGNTRTVIDRVYSHHVELAKNGDERTSLVEFTAAILDVLKDMNLHQSLKTDVQRIDKIFTPEGVNYWNFLRTKGNKTLIDQETYDFCNNAVEIIKTNKDICKLIACNLNEFENKEVFNEIKLNCNVNNRAFGLKGIIDNLVIDHDEKIVYINDVKTTSKDLKDFPETIEFYGYWMQAAIYSSLVVSNYAHLINDGYDIKFNFVVIDKMYNVYAFPVSTSTLMSWLTRLEECLVKADWHYTSNEFNLPYDFAQGLVTL